MKTSSKRSTSETENASGLKRRNGFGRRLRVDGKEIIPLGFRFVGTDDEFSCRRNIPRIPLAELSYWANVPLMQAEQMRLRREIEELLQRAALEPDDPFTSIDTIDTGVSHFAELPQPPGELLSQLF